MSQLRFVRIAQVEQLIRHCLRSVGSPNIRIIANNVSSAKRIWSRGVLFGQDLIGLKSLGTYSGRLSQFGKVTFP